MDQFDCANIYGLRLHHISIMRTSAGMRQRVCLGRTGNEYLVVQFWRVIPSTMGKPFDVPAQDFRAPWFAYVKCEVTAHSINYALSNHGDLLPSCHLYVRLTEILISTYSERGCIWFVFGLVGRQAAHAGLVIVTNGSYVQLLSSYSLVLREKNANYDQE